MRSKALEKAQHRIEACRSKFPTRFPGCAHPTTVPSCAGSKERHRSAQTCTKARSENVRQIAWRNAAGLDAPLHRGIEPPSSRAQRNGLPMLATKADEAVVGGPVSRHGSNAASENGSRRVQAAPKMRMAASWP